MTKHVVVTSFTEKGYQQYGKRFLESFYKFMPSNVKLVVYYEGTNLRDGWKTINEVQNLDAWMRAIAPFQLMSGALFDQYDIKYDARTNRVIFIQNHALRTFKGKVFWMDGDSIVHSPVPESFFDEVLPDDKLNYNHPGCEHFLRVEENTLFSGIIFAQPRWWDMVTFDWSMACVIARDPEMRGAFVNLSEGLPEGCMHPYVNSELGKYFDHLKGNRKGKTSTKDDLVVERTEPYWKEILAA
jgi:hypothetical protein